MPRIEPALAQRLELLTGEAASSCCADYKGDVAALRASASFRTGLARAKALGDERRYTTWMLLRRRGEMCACEIQAALGITHATVSHHMHVLCEAGLVTCEKRGKWAYYRPAPEAKVFP
ncbi:MAG TPA: metalloregulator ArsR/SmtB family transcription factor [Candidatus Thermoplasmatota archaeon]|nr:metalloregulator ArsR/SmtB family transcription factor [Candidatus Thermoplasmatota archaeon]